MLSRDNAVRQCAKNKCIEHHGMLWVFDRLIGSAELIGRSTAISKINQLFETNFIYQNNAELKSEIDNRIGIWSS